MVRNMRHTQATTRRSFKKRDGSEAVGMFKASKDCEVKTCSKCGAVKPLADFYRGFMCKACRVGSQLRRKKERKEEERLKALAEAQARRESDLVSRNIALPRTFTFTETYVPDSNFYQRNNGNKHIQSRGV